VHDVEKNYIRKEDVAGLRSGGQDGALIDGDRQGRHRNSPTTFCKSSIRWSFSSMDRRNDQGGEPPIVSYLKQRGKKKGKSFFLGPTPSCAAASSHIFSSRDGHTAARRRSPHPGYQKIALLTTALNPIHDTAINQGLKKKPVDVPKCLIG